MSYSKEDFFSMVENMKMKREDMAERQKLEEEKRRKELIEKEKKLEKEIDKRTDYLLEEYYDTIIKKTLESFMSCLEKLSFPPYEVYYTLEQIVMYGEKETSLFEKKIKNKLIEEMGNIPNSVLTVLVKDSHIDHGHEECDQTGGRWVYDYTEYKLVIEIIFNC